MSAGILIRLASICEPTASTTMRATPVRIWLAARPSLPHAVPVLDQVLRRDAADDSADDPAALRGCGGCSPAAAPVLSSGWYMSPTMPTLRVVNARSRRISREKASHHV